ncbi:MAG: Stp1/IreP family PP2C-type Ser/Thr phosphatase [Syntrophomonadaceae bacterium]|nr:Stp1/IreP family PP2C-type Ser/Thr phosphatase [Syntrophomonadaceae bacterium]
MIVAAVSDKGRVRSNNEDSLLVKPEQGLFIVCDGMGGHNAGEVASRLAVQCIEDSLQGLGRQITALDLNKAILKANELVWQQGQDNPEWREMGTTVTAAMIREDQLLVVNVGDSCLYLIRDGAINKVTHDHTLAQEMVKDGLLRPDEVKSSGYNHILTRALGVHPSLEIDHFEEKLKSGDSILICSDGLSDILLDDEILNVVLEHDNSLQNAVDALRDQALAGGGYDNISLILLKV